MQNNIGKYIASESKNINNFRYKYLVNLRERYSFRPISQNRFTNRFSLKPPKINCKFTSLTPTDNPTAIENN